MDGEGTIAKLMLHLFLISCERRFLMLFVHNNTTKASPSQQNKSTVVDVLSYRVIYITFTALPLPSVERISSYTDIYILSLVMLSRHQGGDCQHASKQAYQMPPSQVQALWGAVLLARPDHMCSILHSLLRRQMCVRSTSSSECCSSVLSISRRTELMSFFNLLSTYTILDFKASTSNIRLLHSCINVQVYRSQSYLKGHLQSLDSAC